MYKTMFDFFNKKVVVAGGNGLLGREVVKAFQDFNADVIILDIVDKLSDDIILRKNDIYRKCNLTSNTEVQETICELFKTHSNIVSWINIFYPRTSDWNKNLRDVEYSWFQKNIDLHLGSYFWISKLVLENFASQELGSLVNFASIYGMLGPNFSLYEDTQINNPVAYAAIKGGIINLTRYFATYFGSKNVRVNCISPGGIFDGQDIKFVERYSKLTPMNRMGDKSEIAGSVIYLASSASVYVTGQNLVIDGGWSSH